MGNIYSAVQTKEGIGSINSYSSILDKNALGGRFFRIKGTNKMIEVRSLLTEAPAEVNDNESTAPKKKYGYEKFSLKEEILESDIKDGVLIDKDIEYKANLLELINNQLIDKSKKIRIFYEGKLVELEPELYNMLGYKEKEGAEEQQYYRTKNNTFLKKKDITPPAFKQMTDEEVTSFFDRGNGGTVYSEYKKFAMVKFVDKDNKIHYVRDVKVKYEFNKKTGAYDALIETEEKRADGNRRVNLKTVQNISTPTAKMSTSLKVRRRASTGVNEQYAIYNEDGSVRANVDVSQSQSENKNLRIHHKVNGHIQDIQITNNLIKVNGFSCAIKSANFKYVEENEAEHHGTLSLEFEAVSMENVVLENGVIKALKSKDGKELRLENLPFGIKFKGNLEKTKVDDKRLGLYKESKVFTRDADGKSVLEADIIQTSPIGPNGECVVYDYNERQSVFFDFEKNIEKLKEISKKGLTSGKDLETLANLQKNIDEQLAKLGDFEVAKEIEDKRKILVEEKAKTGKDRDAVAIEKAQQAYNEALNKLGYYKDKANLAQIDDLINRYQQGEFFPTFYFDEKGNKVEINSGELTTLTSNLPFDWSKTKGLESVIGKDKVAFDKTSGKAKISFSSNAKEMAVGSLKLSGMLLNASFTLGPASLLIMPIALPLAGVSLAVAGATATVEGIRTKTKQAKLNRMKPQDLKDMQDRQLKSCIAKEFEQALEQYNEALAHADRNFTSESNRKKLRITAENAFRQRRKEIFNQYLLAAAGNINSKFNAKDKKITNENIYGFLEFRRRKEEILKGKDPSTDLTVQEYKKTAKAKYDKEKEQAKIQFAHHKKLLAKKLKQLEVDKNNAENEFLSEFGPLNKRVDYLKKTSKYYRATNVERAQMVKDCTAKCDEAIKSISVEEVAVKGREGKELELFKQEIIEIAKSNAPDLDIRGKAFNDLKYLLSSDFDVPISVSAEEQHLKESHEDKEAEEMNEIVREYTKVSEKCKEISDENNVVKSAHAVAELYHEQEKVEERLKTVLKDDDLIVKVLEDIELWKGQKVDPDARQLEEFINELEVQTDKQKFLAQQYGNSLTNKVQQKIDALKEELKDDDEALDVFKEENFKRIKKYLAGKTLKSRYGVEAGMNEKIMRMFKDAESEGEKKRDYLVKIHKTLEKEELERIEKEKEVKRDVAIRMAKDFINSLDVKTYNKYIGIIEIVENASKYSINEVDKAVKFILKKQREKELSKPEVSA